MSRLPRRHRAQSEAREIKGSTGLHCLTGLAGMRRFGLNGIRATPGIRAEQSQVMRTK